MKVFVNIILLFVIVGVKLFAQDPSHDFKQINLAYLNKNFSADTKYALYKSITDKVALQTETGHFKYNSILSKTRLELGKYTIISSKDFSLTVNSKEKFIAFTKMRSTDKNDQPAVQNTDQMLMLVDTIIKLSKDIQYKEIDKQTGEYLFFPAFGEYNKVRIRFSKENYLITQLEFFYKKNHQYLDETGKEAKPRLEILYENILVNPEFTNEDFSYKKYIYEQNGRYYLTQAYKMYKLSYN